MAHAVTSVLLFVLVCDSAICITCCMQFRVCIFVGWYARRCYTRTRILHVGLCFFLCSQIHETWGIGLLLNNLYKCSDGLRAGLPMNLDSVPGRYNIQVGSCAHRVSCSVDTSCREGARSLPHTSISDKVKNMLVYTSALPYVLMAWCLMY
jgi:hypothetical protein